jgi:hypothetical protein
MEDHLTTALGGWAVPSNTFVVYEHANVTVAFVVNIPVQPYVRNIISKYVPYLAP